MTNQKPLKNHEKREVSYIEGFCTLCRESGLSVPAYSRFVLGDNIEFLYCYRHYRQVSDILVHGKGFFENQEARSTWHAYRRTTYR